MYQSKIEICFALRIKVNLMTNINQTIIMQTFKICIIGGPQTGKTTFIQRFTTGQFENLYIPTVGVKVGQINFQSNLGTYLLNIWDIAGEQKIEAVRDGYFHGADAAIAFYTSGNIEETNKLVADFGNICPNAPIINVWNKSDLRDEWNFVEQTFINNSNTIKQGNRLTYQVSAKSNYNFEKPYLALLRILMDNPQLSIR